MFWTLVASRGSGGGVLLRSLCPGVVTASRCTQPQSRSFSGTVPATQSEAKPCPVRRRSISVSPFVNVRTHLDCSISIRPLDTHAFPGADRAFITVHGPDSEQQEVGLDHLHVHCDGEGKELVITSEKINTKAIVEMDAPIKSSECEASVQSSFPFSVQQFFVFCQISSSQLEDRATCKSNRWSVISAEWKQKRATVCCTLLG